VSADRRLRALLAALGLAAAPAQAQRVVLEGRGVIATDTILRRAAATTFHVITADTVVPATDTLRGPVLIAATTVKLENVIIGDLLIIDANVFLRPNARITGSVISIAGGLFRAETATIEGTVREYKDAPYRAELRDDGIHVVGTEVESNLDLDGFGGFLAPTYDRVSGLNVTIGGRYLLPRIGAAEPWIGGRIGYLTAREKFVGLAHAGVDRGAFQFRAGLERAVATHDAWVRGWSNTISYLTRGHDYRDYYQADRFYVGPVWRGVIAGAASQVTLDAQIEDARSLRSRDAWHVSGDTARPNPAIDDGRITSLRIRSELAWESNRYIADIDAGLETALTAFDGEHEFTRFDFGGLIALRALANHSFQVRWRARGPMPGTDSLPRQRWNTMGGRATLWTLDEGELRGDRLLYINSAYLIPLPRALTLPILGRPAIEAVHRIGNAWTRDQDAELVQNVGLGLRFRIAFVTAIVDPADRDDSLILFGFSIPRRFPWTPVD